MSSESPRDDNSSPRDVWLLTDGCIGGKVSISLAAAQKMMVLKECTGGEVIPVPRQDPYIVALAARCFNAPDNNEELIGHEHPKVLCGLSCVANYLGDKDLLNWTCSRIADRTRGRTPTEIREIFNMPKLELILNE